MIFDIAARPLPRTGLIAARIRGSPMARADLAIKLDTADDLDRLRRAVEQMTAVGGDCACLGSLLAERLRGLPDARLARRDEALAALAQTYVGRLWTVSGNVSTEPQRYAASAW